MRDPVSSWLLSIWQVCIQSGNFATVCVCSRWLRSSREGLYLKCQTCMHAQADWLLADPAERTDKVCSNQMQAACCGVQSLPVVHGLAVTWLYSPCLWSMDWLSLGHVLVVKGQVARNGMGEVCSAALCWRCYSIWLLSLAQSNCRLATPVLQGLYHVQDYRSAGGCGVWFQLFVHHCLQRSLNGVCGGRQLMCTGQWFVPALQQV